MRKRLENREEEVEKIEGEVKSDLIKQDIENL